MTRFFYRDPLAAAWMAKHFGMRFDNLAEMIAGIEGDITLFVLPKFVNDCRKTHRYYICNDSLHLLKPQAGDSIQIKDPDYYMGSQLMFVCHKHSSALRLPLDSKFRGEDFRIIQRNGIPFMRPESAAA